ncbi:MAG: MFS transporter [Saprospiraceae bacterium]|nr:MFS transporter [Saprospiraceae bacterium]
MSTQVKTYFLGVNPKVFPLLVVNFIGALGYSVILPFLVFLVIDFGGNEVMYGLVGSLYPLFQMFGAPVLGSWSDRVGRKRVLLISQAGTFLSWCIFLIAFVVPIDSLFEVEGTSIGMITITVPILILMAARAFDGLTGGNISVANAYLADITDAEDRKANYGKLAAAMNLGFIIGPTLAGLLASLPAGKWWTVVASAGISFIGIFIIQFLLPDVKPCGEDLSDLKQEDLKKVLNREHMDCIPPPNNEAHFNVWQVNSFPIYLFLYFLIFLVFNFFYASFPVYASKYLGWDSSALGVFFTILASSMIVTQTFLLPRLSKSVNDWSLFIVGCFILSLSFGLLVLPPNWAVYSSAILYGLGNGLMWPSFLSMLSQLGDKSQQGRIQGFAGSAGSLASIIGLIAGGFIFSVIGEQIFLFSAIGIFLIGIFGFRLKNN